MDGGLVHAVAEHVVDRAVRAVDRQLGEVRAAEPGQLGVEVGEQPRLHQRVVGDLDARDEIAGVERDLLGLGEVVGRVLVQRELADQLHRCQLFGHELGGVEQVDALEAVRAVVGQDLEAELALEEGAGLDPVGQVAAVEVGIDSRPRSALPPRPVNAPRRPASSGTSPGLSRPRRSRAGRCGPRILPWCGTSAGCRGRIMFHITWWVASVCSETKSQNVSCADWACGISRRAAA